ncbi:MAG: hypothetical protein RMM31_00995 [Anaerolineae bacterium]|nr:hypothetical protein [Anaerolineae bacterium]
MLPNSSKSIRLAGFVVVAAVLGVGAGLLLLIAGGRPAPSFALARPNHNNLFAPTQFFTDIYDLQGDNSVVPTLLQGVGLASCDSPIILTPNNATFYRLAPGLNLPSEDTDIYRIPLVPQLQYTLVVTPVISPLEFFAVLQDPTFNVIRSLPNVSPTVVISFPSTAGGNFQLTLKAANAFAISQTSQNLPYRITICSAQLPPPTPTPLPGLSPDALEPNDFITEANTPITNVRATASFIAVGTTINNLSFYPFDTPTRTVDSADWFRMFGLAGVTYQVETSNVQPGVETVLEVFDAAGTQLIAGPNNRHTPGQRGSRVVFTPPSQGIYWIRVTNIDQSPRVPGQTYSLSVIEVVQPTATPPPTPTPVTPTPYPPGMDQFEYNGDFDFATQIAPGVKYGPLNFVPFQPPSPGTVDNDFFKLPVKQGVFYTCETLDLAPGVDTNIIVYNQDRAGIGGNDDISPEERIRGNFRSRFSWLSGYTGIAYVLVGDVNPPRADQAAQRTYSLQCSIGLPETPTPTPQAPTSTPTPPPIPPTPLPPEPEPTPFPTPRTAQNLAVRPIEPTLLPPSAPQPTPTPRIAQVTVQIFNDLNRNGQLDSATGEGILGVSVRIFDESTGVPLAQGLTDSSGQVRFSVETNAPLRVSVPLFAYSTVITDSPGLVRIGVISRVSLPRRVG